MKFQGQVKVSSKVDDIEQKKPRGIHELKKKLEKGQEKEVKLFLLKLNNSFAYLYF